MKEHQLEYERKFLSPYAQKSEDTRGRQTEIEPCPYRTEYQRDRDRIIHCKAFRRLKHKTQVFLCPLDDHFRTRLTHTLEVTQIARTISRALLLNEDLTEAIGLGHDLGHTPFGHAGERVLNALTGHFYHNEQSLRVVDILENDGKGLNLTYEVRNGILEHKSSGNPCTLEGKVVSYADRIAYINHDISDAIRAGVIEESDLPRDCVEYLGKTKGDRINTLVKDVVEHSYGKDKISLSDDGYYYMNKLRDFMFERVYFTNSGELLQRKADRMLNILFKYF
ncbi:MAG: deoxyguanosinetriphosphate triphosphohydrolase, partial [Christensenellales bacterium]